MAKQQTRLELQQTIAAMHTQMQVLQDRIEKKDAIILEKESQINTQKAHTQDVLNHVGMMLRGDGEMIVVGNPFGSIQLPKMTLASIAYNIGELQMIKREYFDLKDRALPVPKMQLVAEERNDKNNRRG